MEELGKKMTLGDIILAEIEKFAEVDENDPEARFIRHTNFSLVYKGIMGYVYPLEKKIQVLMADLEKEKALTKSLKDSQVPLTKALEFYADDAHHGNGKREELPDGRGFIEIGIKHDKGRLAKKTLAEYQKAIT